MFGHNVFMPTLFKLLLPKLRYMGDDKCRIHLDTMWKVYMMAVLNLKTARDRCSPPVRDPNKTNFKRGYMVLIKNHTPKDTFDSKYKPSFRICKKISDKAHDVQDSARKVRWVSVQHLQLLYHTEHVLTNLPDITLFGHTTKYINHPDLMPDLSTAINRKNAHAWHNEHLKCTSK